MPKKRKAFHLSKRPSKPHLGLRILYAYTILLALLYVSYLVIGIYQPSLLLLQSYSSLVLDVILLAMLGYVIYGFLYRKYWVWKLAMAWYTFAIFYSIILVYFIRKGIYLISPALFLVSSLLIIFINGLIVWYLYCKRHYFLDKTHADVFTSHDKFFVYCMICFWAVLITISVTVGVKLYHDTTQLADSLIDELRDVGETRDWQEGYQRCAAKSGAGKDVCYVVLATISNGQAAYCQNIESVVYRLSCVQARRA